MFIDKLFPSNQVREKQINERLYVDVKRTGNTALPMPDRTASWDSARKTVINKGFVKEELFRHLRPARGGEPVVCRTVIDDRIIEGFAPQLKTALDKGSADYLTAMAIVEYFTRTGHHGLSPEQTVALATNLSSDAPIPGKSPEESWVMRREIADILELNRLIEDKHLGLAYGKTISVTQLTKISADALRTLHQAGTRLGLAQVDQKDRALVSSKKTLMYPDFSAGGIYQLLSHPDLLLSMILSPGRRNFDSDMEQANRLPADVNVLGSEHIPVDGPAIFAFYHRDQWDDPKMPIFWEKLKMISEIKKKRTQSDINVAAYMSYHSDSAPAGFRGVVKNVVIPLVSKVAKERYGLNILDIKGESPETMKSFLRQSQTVLQAGQSLLISPEGIPVLEAVKPRRGLGMIARSTGAPVIGVAFREDVRTDGTFGHSVIFIPAKTYPSGSGSSQIKDQQFSNQIMRDIAQQLPESERGIFK